jgi:hypothetical protein
MRVLNSPSHVTPLQGRESAFEDEVKVEAMITFMFKSGAGEKL